MSDLQALLDRRTATGAPELTRREGERLRCLACGHRCLLSEGRRGICKVRFVEGGELRVPEGYLAGLHADPIEKKPFFHVRPGSLALSFGMLGCDLHCAYCQNWNTSQSLRDLRADSRPRPLSAREIVDPVASRDIKILVSTYNEPLITSEWSHRIFSLAKRRGILTGYVSNGNATPEVLDYLKPVCDLMKIDLKSFRDRSYRKLGCPLKNVLQGIELAFERGFWIEVVTLVVPGFNDSSVELSEIAGFLAGLSPDIPWHVSAFHPDYKMCEPEPTPVETLKRAREIGLGRGLRYVYAGNLRGALPGAEDSRCASCGEVLVRRTGYRVTIEALREGNCGKCGAAFPGRFTPSEGSP